jgi:hypothetical protein
MAVAARSWPSSRLGIRTSEPFSIVHGNAAELRGRRGTGFVIGLEGGGGAAAVNTERTRRHCRPDDAPDPIS